MSLRLRSCYRNLESVFMTAVWHSEIVEEGGAQITQNSNN